MPDDLGTAPLPPIWDVVKSVRWHRNASDMAQAYGTHDELALLRRVLIHEGFKEGIRIGDFNMTYTTPRSKVYARLSVYNTRKKTPEGMVTTKDNIAQLQLEGADIADTPSLIMVR